MWPDAGTRLSNMEVTEFMPEAERRQSSASSKALIFSSVASTVGFP